jgi:hypothetical protein
MFCNIVLSERVVRHDVDVAGMFLHINTNFTMRKLTSSLCLENFSSALIMYFTVYCHIYAHE